VHSNRLQGRVPASLRDLVGDTLIIYPRAPRPSYADQVLALFHDRALEPASIYEARELQIALGLVAAGEGVSVVPRSVAGLQREDVSYMELDDPQLVSPIIFSKRLQDESEDIQAILNLTYRLYEEQKIPHYRPT
jgi:DNA-binding transcriptional LysR family regulator